MRTGLPNPTEIALRLFRRCRLPQRWAARRGDARWLGEFADEVEDFLHCAGIVDEGDDARLTVADWATHWQGFIDARQQHGALLPKMVVPHKLSERDPPAPQSEEKFFEA